MMLGHFKAQITALTRTVEAQTEKSDQGRTKIYRDLEEIRKEQLITKMEVAEVKEDIKQAKPTLTWIEVGKERFTGMLCLVVGGALGGPVVIFWKRWRRRSGWSG